ncbi:GNAT family acetyltransferase [Pseudomonas sp. 250J]|uniref:GNAT family N-acetyltransferase n=1 Tax=Pseudomonas peradeniyensis TaxID=2745488 RepID=A0ABT2V9X2_9PSED|nr:MULTISPECIES: GNAT family N-acetyltransferase [Pseudomonas]KNX77078.1 GNAT family acetyltransferase [Pseudomonas sp. 250J]MCU7238509.1 GNAT family N-acetyltransferase [Pseudomonas peradeniyensis]MCU7281090.1 GNAT family N-acetyltransferase [Pseudomonas peradeniyensis]QZA52774.1 GNAT family N-acetyltransferase [Pseudomonas sp. 2hn]
MDAAIRLRRAMPDDADEVAVLVAEAYSPYIARIGRVPAPMLDDYRQVVQDDEVFVAIQDTRIVGVLVLRQEGSVMLLVNVAVLPDCKGQGIGRRLMAFCEEHARATGCMAVRLYTHERMVENIEIYRKAGYRETHRATEDGFARLFMKKTILLP